MLKLLRNNLYFKNVTYHRNDYSNQCLTCSNNVKNGIHFIHCSMHSAIMKEIIDQMIKAKLILNFQKELSFFFNYQDDINHPSDIVYISTLHSIYSLRFSSTPPLQIPNLSFLCQIMSDLYQTFRIGPLVITHIIFNVQLHTILQISCQEPSTSSKPQSNSLAELSLYQHIGQNTCHVLGASQPVDG